MQHGNRPARLFLGIAYALLIALLGIAIWFRGTPASTAILVLVGLIIVGEAVYVMLYTRDRTLCSLCTQWMCTDDSAPPR